MINSNEALKTPILFLVFNRPICTEKVFKAIAAARPSKLYVAADGARSDRIGENDLCAQVRSIATMVDWECQVETRFQNENLGCREAVSGAIDWFFEHEEEGIILEDDCLPAPAFFLYCQRLLEDFRDVEEVMMIAGSNFQSSDNQKLQQYYFSKVPHIWGWATWRRAWQHYDLGMADFEQFIRDKKWRELSEDLNICYYWMKCFCGAYQGEINTWDYQWVYQILANGGYAITPGINLIKNIGVGSDATHTFSGYAPELSKMNTGQLSKLSAPEKIEHNANNDNYTYNRILNATFQIIRNPLLRWKKSLRRGFRVRSMMNAITPSE